MHDPNKKTIAIVINTSWNIFNFRMGLLKALKEEGYNIVAIAPYDFHTEKLIEYGFEYHDINMNNKGTNPIEEFRLFREFYSVYKEVNPDLLLQYTIKPNVYGSLAASLLDIPVISNISGLGTVFLNKKPSSIIARLLYKLALHRKAPKKVFFQNQNDRALFIKSKLVKKKKTDILPGSGIDIEKFKPLEREVRRAKSLHFLFIARLIRDKGLGEYVEAARMLKSKYPEAVFNILGTYYPGNPTAVTHDEIEMWEAEGIIHHLGATDEVSAVIAEHDCVVLPSYREGLSRVLLEGASMAKPIVTTNVPGCKNVVDDDITGYLCNVKDADSLAQQMEKVLLLSEDERSEMGQRGREKVIAEFDERIIIEKYQKAIRTIFS
ncbi:glycosyltransferase family 4 protein [Sulfurovum sp. XTW-4]|uniref:Glycosyltransferase family 4 protein n=1 Tax=Sulfurovum xiamenensis TaxID=3019066 RepID=A0ABT7QNK8_9BACT|nr:glycosyltransferase family 4 protein [Sulfurovum xiamenensis]MDM5262626.1 glycosyltransferase family 4 protein [Sulfurovum xiamenensis]